MVTIEDGTQHLAEIAELFEEYKAYIAVDVSFQPADQTAAEITRRYGGDGGRRLLPLRLPCCRCWKKTTALRAAV